jgi:hypothetical protein
MSAYRNKPPPPRWRVVYRTPFLQRVGRGAVLGGFGVLALGSILAVSILLLIGTVDEGIVAGVAGLSIPVFLTAAAFLLVHWGTHLSDTAERTISSLQADPSDPTRCRALCGNERWSLPLRRQELREGQTIQVRYRDIAPESSAASGREILEIKIIEE